MIDGLKAQKGGQKLAVWQVQMACSGVLKRERNRRGRLPGPLGGGKCGLTLSAMRRSHLEFSCRE